MHWRATAAAVALLALSCARVLPWSDEPTGNEINLAFTLERNLVELHSVRLDNRSGRFILGSAAPRTVVDPRFHRRTWRGSALQMSERETVRIDPVALDLRGVADAIIGAEPWRNRAITIDYRTGLVTYQKDGIQPGYMHVYRYEAAPMIHVIVDGREIAAVVDTASPDTLVLPRAQHGRGTAHVRVAETDFGAIDVQYANVSQARIGNRLLSRFMVTIDYGRRVVGLWRDPRV
jgi:hypothetical protein